MKITDYLKSNIVYLDGGMGTLLQEQGLRPGELPETWNLSHPDVITKIHREYFDAGSNVVSTNTFGANLLKFSHMELSSIIKAAVENARRAADESSGTQKKWVALDIGPSGRMLAPYGDFDFEDAVSLFAETVKIGVACGVDLILIETMNDSYETKAALLAAKENSDLPVFVSNAYSADGKLMTGASPAAMVAMLEGMGADAIGVNCSLGPKALLPIVDEYLAYASIPVLVKPNAGLPKAVNGKTVYDVLPNEFSTDLSLMIMKGVTICGGCCGTTPDYIRALTEKTSVLAPKPVKEKNITLVSSYTHAVTFGKKPVLIGERINPTGKKRFKEALKNNEIDYILKEGISQQEKGVDILDVNVGLPEIDEVLMLKTAVCELQAVTDLPLQIDTSNITAMEAALRRYNGKPLINSVNGKKDSMDAVFPLVKKYGGVVVALTLDETGIPKTANERVEIAERILVEASKYGIASKNIIFDPLALTISADDTAGIETLKAVRMIKTLLDCHTSLGVSNVSFGLPRREVINSTFFALALGYGLSAAIMNPYSDDMMKAYYAFLALNGLDPNCSEYIEFAESLPQVDMSKAAVTVKEKVDDASELQNAIIKGLKEVSAKVTEDLLKTDKPLDIIQNEIIPALDAVGIGYEEKRVYLPQLLMSAEAAKSAFEVIKSHLPEAASPDKCPFVISTVKGDIHDIGKNIVKLLLENYGFSVIDLGRDVPPETVVCEVEKHHAPMAGLSALMTTTVPAMEETIKLLHEKTPWCKVIVGGAVLNQEYANSIHADFYAKDAMETVRIAEDIYKNL
ncbi:MAG: homocysteine S-methyltransferase family protein [Clostridia bacterium]|nr:homocysteine S-methyltransferase family protein [Clostridia bacterium]